MPERHIFVCESGWRRIRETSLTLGDKNIPSTVLIEGQVEKEVKQMITSRKGIKNVFIPEKLFTPFLFVYLITLALAGKRPIFIYLSKEKTYRRLDGLNRLFPRLKLVKLYDN